MRQLCHSQQIDDIAQRVRGGLEKQQSGRIGHCRLPSGNVAERYEIGLHPKTRQQIAEQPARRPKQIARGDDMIASRQQPHTERQNGPHPGTGTYTSLGSLQFRQALLKQPDAGIGEARVHRPWNLIGEGRARLLGRFKYEAGGEKQGFGVFSLVRGALARAYRTGLKSSIAFDHCKLG